MKTSLDRRRVKDVVSLGGEVRAALDEGRPVVLLESGALAHGLPRPLNVATALEVEEAVRARGAVPATTGVADGRILVGMSTGRIEEFGTAEGIAKLSARDVAWCLGTRRRGATSIAATLVIAELVGIEVVASAGLGGVHRGVEETWDVSADLIQLTRSPVLMVSAGVKSILDVPKTLEYLETHGVPVVGLGSSRFPGFYTADSGSACPREVESPQEAAEVWGWHRRLLGGGMLLTRGLPPDRALPDDVVADAVAQAQRAALAEGVSGAPLTPFMTRFVDRATQGAASRANADVLVHTAEVAADVAVALTPRTLEAMTS